jgi:hypothetical protein
MRSSRPGPLAKAPSEENINYGQESVRTFTFGADLSDSAINNNPSLQPYTRIAWDTSSLLVLVGTRPEVLLGVPFTVSTVTPPKKALPAGAGLYRGLAHLLNLGNTPWSRNHRRANFSLQRQSPNLLLDRMKPKVRVARRDFGNLGKHGAEIRVPVEQHDRCLSVPPTQI